MSSTLLHNPRCSKSRQALQLLEEQGIDLKVRRYLDDPLTVEELQQLLELLQKEPQAIIRTGEAIYKELQLANKELSKHQWLGLLAEHPKLIERPIFIHQERACIGRPPEKVLELI